MEKELKEFIKKVEKTFGSEKRDYLIAYAIKKGKKTTVNVIIDDRDVERMEKSDLLKKMQSILNDLNPIKNSMDAKSFVISDLNNKNIWNVLGESCVIKNTKALTIFLNTKLPNNFQRAFEKLPEKFKLDDLRRKLKETTKRDYHRNTYQIWLNFLINAEFITRKEKTYYKTNRTNRVSTLNELEEMG